MNELMIEIRDMHTNCFRIELLYKMFKIFNNFYSCFIFHKYTLIPVLQSNIYKIMLVFYSKNLSVYQIILTDPRNSGLAVGVVPSSHSRRTTFVFVYPIIGVARQPTSNIIKKEFSLVSSFVLNSLYASPSYRFPQVSSSVAH